MENSFKRARSEFDEPDKKRRKCDAFDNVSTQQVLTLLKHCRKVITKAPDFALNLLTQNGEMCIALLHAQALLGVLPEKMSFLPLSNEEVETAKHKSQEIHEKLSKYRFWHRGTTDDRENKRQREELDPHMFPASKAGGMTMQQRLQLQRQQQAALQSKAWRGQQQGHPSYWSVAGAAAPGGQFSRYGATAPGARGPVAQFGAQQGQSAAWSGYGAAAQQGPQSRYGGGPQYNAAAQQAQAQQYAAAAAVQQYGQQGASLYEGARRRTLPVGGQGEQARPKITADQRQKLLERISRLTPEQFQMLPSSIQEQARMYLGASVTG